MFDVTFRTISNLGKEYQPHIVAIGSHKAQSKEQAAIYVKNKFKNVEILNVEYVGSL